MSFPGALNQVTWPGAGDVDDCWVVATIWNALAAGIPRPKLPTVPEFRAAAGNPDDPYRPDGGTNEQTLQGARALWPKLGVAAFTGEWGALRSQLLAGKTASVPLLSGLLPSTYRYGFAGRHRVSLYADGGRIWIVNPLQASGSPGRAIAETDLVPALQAISGGTTVYAAIFPPAPPPPRDAMLLAVGLLDSQTHQPTKGVRTKAGTKLYDQIDGASFASLPTARELPLLAIPEGHADWRLVLVDTSRGGKDSEVYIHWADVTASFDLPDPTPFGAELKAKLDELDGALVTAHKLAAQAQATATAAQAVITEIRDIVGA